MTDRQVHPATAAEWADMIRGDLSRAVQGILDAGEHLRQARESGTIKHGDWEEWVRGLGISPRSAQRLMSISRSNVLKATSVSLLPAAMSTLFELSRLPPQRLRQAIEQGKVTPETSREQARALRFPPPRSRPRAERLRVTRDPEPAEPPAKTERDLRDASGFTRALTNLNAARGRVILAIDALAGMHTELDDAQQQALRKAADDVSGALGWIGTLLSGGPMDEGLGRLLDG